jgi:hypothetical protein
MVCFLMIGAALVSFAQVYKGEAETKNGSAAFLLHYVEYSGFRYLFYIDGVSVFLDEANMERLGAALDKFAEWEEIARVERITLTKTIDSVTFTGFHYDHTFFREPVTFYLVFTGGPSGTAAPESESDVMDSILDDSTIDGGITADSGAGSGITGGTGPGDGMADNADNAANTQPSPYTLFVDTTLDRITPFRLSSITVHDMRAALSPEKLLEAWDAYEQQRALEGMFQ